MDDNPLDNMGKWSRNERLYDFLKAQGLYVEPVWGPGEHGGVEYLRVSVAVIQDQQDQG